MLSNFHTHTTFCDGEDTPEDIVISALEKGFSAIGFSGHGHTPFDCSFCMPDTEGYRREILRLKQAYQGQIEVYLGVEEDLFSPVDRTAFDYLISSCHYISIDNHYYSLDFTKDELAKAIAAFGGNTLSFAETYYRRFCEYLLHRKPDIIGHFDILTKFDEQGEPFFLDDERYHRLAEHYIRIAAQSGCLFEVNTGAMLRGYRTQPHPHSRLLYALQKAGGDILLSSDSHRADTLDGYFDDMRVLLKECGFRHTYTLQNNTFVPVEL